MFSKLKGRCTQFNPSVLDDVDANGDRIGSWCSAGSKPEEAFCSLCNTVIKCNQHGVSAVKRHAVLKKHVQLSRSMRDESGKLKKCQQQQQLSVTSWNAVKIANKDNVTVAEIKFALMVAQNDIPYSFGDIASAIFPDMFMDSKIAKDFSCSRKKISYMISDGIGPYLKEMMVKDILKCGAFYSIQIDETPISEKRVNQLDVLIRYFSETHQKIIVNHLESFHIGHCTSENLLECITESLAELPSEKLLSFYSDGPNVMKSLKTKLKTVNPQLLDIGECSLHKAHNAFAAALNSFGSETESLILDIYVFFKRSAAQFEDFRALQIEMGVAQHMFTRHVSSRWLTLNQSLNRFIEQFPVLKAFFDKKTKKFNVRETERWCRLCLSFSDKTTFVKALFLQNSSDLFNGFLLLLQKEEPLVHLLYDELLSLVKKILGRFLVSSVFQGKKGSELKLIDLQKSENWLKRPEVGSDTLSAMASWTSSERKVFYMGARSFYISCAAYLIKSFPLDNKILLALQCLHPLFRYEKASLTYIRQLAIAVPTVISPSNVSSLVDEWILYQSDAPAANETESSTSERIDHYWVKIFAQVDLSGNLKFKYLPYLIKALLTLAHGNADCERGFSLNKNILDSRSSLCVASVNGIRCIKSELQKCGGIKNFEINQNLMKAVKKSWQRYEERTKAEKAAEEKEIKETVASNNLDLLKAEEEQLKKRLESTQILLNKAERSISDGLKRKSFADVECGSVLLKDSNNKIMEIMLSLEKNKNEQMKCDNTNMKKKKQ